MDIRSLTFTYYLRLQNRLKFLPSGWDDYRVLEAGCGNGANARYFKNYIGTDLLVPEVDRGAFPFIQASVERLPLRDDAVDFFYCMSLLEHLDDPVPAIRELYRVAGKGGVVAVPVLDDFPFIYDPVNWVRVRLGRSPVNFGIGGFGHRTLLHRADWRRLLQENGFRVVRDFPEGRVNFFSALEFLLLSIPLSSLDYGGVMRYSGSVNEKTIRLMQRLLFPLYRLLDWCDFWISGCVSHYFLVAKEVDLTEFPGDPGEHYRVS